MEPPCSAQEGVSMETMGRRCYFVYAVLNYMIYVNGGLGLTDKSPNSWTSTTKPQTPSSRTRTRCSLLTLLMWLNETKEWVMVGRLSDKLTRPPCELVAIGRKIYVIGKGLSTVTIDMDTAARVDVFLVTSLTGPRMEHDFSPEKCSVITI
ncbi:F-box/kelch-repeat protein SKIP4-like [Aegilops tauschii subsp. strangulata]|uniref:F-box/kelch-repeat protein SKIP4-like n=1 Tax=Aegilops tauschii subsp. strangulata TaxID=200361 RepID=UPI003CC89900